MRYTIILLLFAIPYFSQAQFTPSKDSLTIIVTDGTDAGKKSALQPLQPDMDFNAPIRPLGMADAIQAGAFLIRPQYGKPGFFLIFCVNDSIDDLQGTLMMNGRTYKGVYRLIRQKSEVGETKDYETEWTESKITRRVLEWNGTEIIPKIETEEN